MTFWLIYSPILLFEKRSWYHEKRGELNQISLWCVVTSLAKEIYSNFHYNLLWGKLSPSCNFHNSSARRKSCLSENVWFFTKTSPDEQIVPQGYISEVSINSIVLRIIFRLIVSSYSFRYLLKVMVLTGSTSTAIFSFLISWGPTMALVLEVVVATLVLFPIYGTEILLCLRDWSLFISDLMSVSTVAEESESRFSVKRSRNMNILFDRLSWFGPSGEDEAFVKGFCSRRLRENRYRSRALYRSTGGRISSWSLHNHGFS